MTFVTIAALVSAMTMTAPQERDSRAPQTNETVTVTRGARLNVSNFAGEVVVKAWDRDSVRIQARHGSRTRVNISTPATGVSITASSPTGPSGSVDYEITAPAWMPVKVNGTYNFVTIEGIQAELSAENVRGDIVIKGGTGMITARTVEGEVIIDGARGRMNIYGVNEGIRVTGSSGDIAAETVNGSIQLQKIESSNVDATTVNGDILYDGTLADRGKYRFASHNGDLVLGLGDSVNATFNVRSYNGDFSAAMPVKGPPPSEVRRGRRVSYTLGNGSAEVEMETFGGDIQLRPAGAIGINKPKTKTKDKHKDKVK